MSGDAATPARTSRRRRWLRAFVWTFGALVVFLSLSGLLLYCTLPEVDDLATSNPKTTAFIELRRAEAARAGKKFELRWTWRPLARISPHLRHAVVAAEDYRFYAHEGVDWDALESAAERNWKAGRFAVGGSTITQQVAKNLYLSPSKNPIRKLREIFIARRLEAKLSKERILEIYLNICEWGDGVFGAEAAARRWFGVSAAELRPAQAARLAIALPNPRRRSPGLKSRALDEKAGRLILRMRGAGRLSPEAAEAALVELGLRKPKPPEAPPAEPPPPPAAPAPPAAVAPEATPLPG